MAAAFRSDPRKAVFPMIPPRAVRAGGGSKVKVLGRKRYSQSPDNRQFAGQLGLPIPSTARPILPENPKEDGWGKVGARLRGGAYPFGRPKR